MYRHLRLSMEETLPIAYEALEGGDARAVADFCASLHAQGFAIVRFTPAAHLEVVAMRAAAAGFFQLEKAEKAAVGDLRYVGDTYAGYRDSATIDAEFLELHTTSAGDAYPPLPKSPDLSTAGAALHARLDAMSRCMLSILAAHIDVPAEAFLAPLDPPTAVPLAAATGLTSSVLRVCHYRGRRGGGGAAAAATSASVRGGAADEIEVLFDEHTDSSFLTLSTLCPTAPGLQLLVDGEWMSVEVAAGVSEFDLEVHVGDFLSFLSRDYFPSCVHRVTRPVQGPGRLSFPFLVRPRQEHVLDTRPYDPTGSNARLVEVSGIPCAHLRKLFDARGKRLLDAKREADEKELARKARGRAYREAALAKLRAGGLSDSSDDDDQGMPSAEAQHPTAAAPSQVAAGTAGQAQQTSRARAAEQPAVGTTPQAAQTQGVRVVGASGEQAATKQPIGALPSLAAGREVTMRSARAACWRLDDLSAQPYPESGTPHYLFCFKQHDLQLDHPTEAVTLQTQCNACYPHLADPKTAFGFRHVHQLDYATSGELELPRTT